MEECLYWGSSATFVLIFSFFIKIFQELRTLQKRLL